jgi:hypothetical protein
MADVEEDLHDDETGTSMRQQQHFSAADQLESSAQLQINMARLQTHLRRRVASMFTLACTL